MALIAAAAGFGAVIFAGVAHWTGGNEPTGPVAVSAHADPLRFAMAALGAAFVGILIVVAFCVPRLWPGKRD